MRRSILSTLASLSTASGKEITDADIVRWANSKVETSGGKTRMRSFKDSSLKNGKFFLDLVEALKPGYVDYTLVMEGTDEQECKANGQSFLPPPFCERQLTQRGTAKLAISIARKLGSLIFIVAEDIVEVRPRLILTFTAALMVLDSA